VIDRVRPEMTVVREETFGPVSPIITFGSIDEAIAIANGTAYGLSSSVCTNRMDDITRFVNELHMGTVNVREVPGYRLELTPFGGIKDSGLGYKEGVQEAMKSFTNTKTYSLAMAVGGARARVPGRPTGRDPLGGWPLNLLAAIALLVWGTHIVRTGMLRVFGENLRGVLSAASATASRGAAAGLGVTSLVQSSHRHLPDRGQLRRQGPGAHRRRAGGDAGRRRGHRADGGGVLVRPVVAVAAAHLRRRGDVHRAPGGHRRAASAAC
jgi:hypothetical protein